MRIFMTGASGYVGSAVVRELIQARHEVVGLVRSDDGASRARDAGAVPLHGDLEDQAILHRGASEADAVIHLGFIHDFSNFKACCELDRKVIATLGGAKRPLLVTSAIGVLPQGSLVTEDTQPGAHPRAASDEAARALGDGVAIVRLPPSTHGVGDSGHGFLPTLIRIAREKGVSAYVGDGENRWPAVHRSDAARLYRLAIEAKTLAPAYHAVAEEGVRFREIAEVIGRRLGVPMVSKSKEEAAAHFGWFANFAAMNVTASGQQTQERLHWAPSGPGLIADLDQDHYFA